MSTAWPFGDLPMFGHRVIYADPAWPFENYSAKGESRNPNRHYPTMSLEQIKALPVGHLAADNAALLLWATDPLLDKAIEVMTAWGFRFVTVAFTWAKRTPNDTGWHMGTGYYTRANPEICLLGMNGRVGLPKSRGVRQLIVEPVREHSRKPDRVYGDIEALFDGPYLELFARQRRAGWSSWGNDVDKFEAAAA
ncbi:MT-A70 family methyltransferase [Sandarakinorhabdus sp. DWP1-3-1]|uniref:MT-A70 family methyltransferase n=1 Tax=Sandarakinorhabdus sp. DWP1-3-1 TaxID=2804627 RepID=UPI003CF54108